MKNQFNLLIYTVFQVFISAKLLDFFAAYLDYGGSAWISLSYKYFGQKSSLMNLIVNIFIDILQYSLFSNYMAKSKSVSL